MQQNEVGYLWSLDTFTGYVNEVKQIGIVEQIMYSIYKISIMKRLENSYLHPLIKYPERNISQPGIEPQAGTLPKS